MRKRDNEIMIKINKKEKDKLRDRLYKRDGEKCYYCGIEEDDFIPIWGEFLWLSRDKMG